jgi:two-component system NtrC family sensor kinase
MKKADHLVVAFRGIPAASAEFLRTNRYFRPTGTGLAELVHGDPVVHQIDVASEPGYESPARRALVELGGARTMIAVALRKEGTLLDSITLYRQEVRPFTQKQIALLQSFAAQAVIAMENARLLDQIRQRQAELRVNFDNMAHGVVMLNSELRLAAWNGQFQEMLDLPEAFWPSRAPTPISSDISPRAASSAPGPTPRPSCNAMLRMQRAIARSSALGRMARWSKSAPIRCRKAASC